MQMTRFLSIELAFLLLAFWIGGPPWTAIGAVGCIAAVAGGVHSGTILPLVPALAWTMAAAVSGNREFFFPYAMHLAAGAAVAMPRGAPVAASAAAGLVGLAFLATRAVQQAPPRVLAVEAVATAVVLAATVVLHTRVAAPSARWWIPFAAATMACVCLAL